MLKCILALECETTFDCSLQEELKYTEKEHTAIWISIITATQFFFN